VGITNLACVSASWHTFWKGPWLRKINPTHRKAKRRHGSTRRYATSVFDQQINACLQPLGFWAGFSPAGSGKRESIPCALALHEEKSVFLPDQDALLSLKRSTSSCYSNRLVKSEYCSFRREYRRTELFRHKVILTTLINQRRIWNALLMEAFQTRSGQDHLIAEDASNSHWLICTKLASRD
jgi:hypothetical protein